MKAAAVVGVFVLVLSLILTVIAFQPETLDFKRCVEVRLSGGEEFTISTFNYTELTEYSYERLTIDVVKEVGNSYVVLVYVSPNTTFYEVVRDREYELMINGSSVFHIVFKADDYVSLNVCLKAALHKYRDYLVLPIIVSWIAGSSILIYTALHQVIGKVRKRITS
ncbi:MAG: hypothetical protein B7O98_07100 [Zestosphaera tikiterensis]|uniref:Uncharacterized protein n=1 Tax=Zestosphaera tikiterensis TaxID=1973259 RepID=A0A2R7Y4H2_9CREN|nr:MAG: hypothetical protein B7O98_07100 [Zestosphaera tikiterensis]